MRQGICVLSIVVSQLIGCNNTPSDFVYNHPEVAPFNSNGREQASDISIIAFGDFGKVTKMMSRTMDTYHAKFPNPDLVFLLGDNTYTAISSPEQYDVFFNYVARDSAAPHYAILGNHDYDNGADQMMLKFSDFDSRWKLPSPYYFEKFSRSGMDVCVWFIDTQKFIATQSKWLDASIQAEKAGCTWTIVSGHHPGLVHGSGARFGSNYIDRFLQPILDRHNVNLYLCGHHHNSQHMTNAPFKTHVFVVGQTMTTHKLGSYAVKGQSVWGTDAEPAFLELKISASTIYYAFHSGYQGQNSAPLHSGYIVH
jgi:tartrate-resistant acid phosphatase type 5